MSRVYALMISLLLAACGAHAPTHTRGEDKPTQPAVPRAQLQKLHEGLERADEAAKGALRVESDKPDCVRACQLSANVCGISEKICGLAKDNPTEAEVRALCKDGARRCERAKARLVERCECVGP